MKSLDEYLSPLLDQLGQSQVKENVKSLSGHLIEGQTGQLWNISSDNAEYTRYLRLLDGSLKTIVDVEKLNISLLTNSIAYFKDKPYIIILHDGSDIRKPESKELEYLDKVRDLEGNIINGYPTFNSVAVDINGQNLRLLQSSPYSRKLPNYLPQSDINDYHSNLLLKARRAEVEALLASGDWYNQNTIIADHVKRINEQIKSINPNIVIIHVYDRGHDSAGQFEYHTANDSLFITRLKTSRNSNEVILNEKGKEVKLKLVNLPFMSGMNGVERLYDKIKLRKKVYQQVKGLFEWSALEINGKFYSVVRVQFYDRKGQKIFKQPMLLITNMEVINEKLATLVFEIYMKRSKIEGVFKFCKEELGWENFRNRKFEGIKNLIGLIYFITGYFYEIESEVIKHPAAQWLANLGKGKGKVTPYYIIRGIGKLYHFLELQELLAQSKNEQNMAKMAVETFFANKSNFE
jgi:hypothetical protein